MGSAGKCKRSRTDQELLSPKSKVNIIWTIREAVDEGKNKKGKLPFQKRYFH